MKGIVIKKFGGPEVLEYTDLPKPEPKPGEVLIKIETAGVNYIDTYQRTGLYKGELPFTPGMEGAGVVEECGAGDSPVKPGERVAYCMARGSYAEYAVVPSKFVVPLPEEIPCRLGASVLLQGMTAHYLAYSSFPVKKNSVVLVHAAGGVTGHLLVQMAKNLGAVVYGTASSREKIELAKAAGAAEVINYKTSDFAEEVMKLTGGKGVDAVYDSVGLTTFEKSLSCLKTRGMLVLFGQSSGAVPPLDIAGLSVKSLYLTRPSLGAYILDRQELEWRSSDLFSFISKGSVKLQEAAEFDLSKAAEAHKALEDRGRTGKILLVP